MKAKPSSAQDEDREVLVHCVPFLPCDPFARHIRAAGQRPRRRTYDALVTRSRRDPPAGAPKKAARTAKAPAKKAATAEEGHGEAAKKAAAEEGRGQEGGDPPPRQPAAAKKAAGPRRRRPRPPADARGTDGHDAAAARAAGRPSTCTTWWSSAPGPAGASCGYWLADAGWDVVVVEKKEFPREKTCGDGLTPRAVRQLADMDLEGALAGSHRYSGPARLRLRPLHRDAVARAPELPQLRLHHHPPRPRRPGGRARRGGRGDPAPGHRGRRPRSSTRRPRRPARCRP